MYKFEIKLAKSPGLIPGLFGVRKLSFTDVLVEPNLADPLQEQIQEYQQGFQQINLVSHHHRNQLHRQ